ncbi:hypothetical protein HDU83_008320 [Entophlyctis luteolus]|nr:hypothetical protein HDU83_008320 [Entophlyctis luteolus]
MATSIPGFSLWLAPPKGSELEGSLRAVIEHYSEETGAPKFDPHVTLLGSVVAQSAEDAAAAVAQVLRTHAPVDVRFTHIVTRDQYFQCVMAKVAETPELMQLHAALRAACPQPPPGPPPPPPFWPHLSLVYGALDAPTRERIAADIARQHPDIPGARFLARNVEIWDTAYDDIAQWARVAVVPFGGGSAPPEV